ncbi:hypothetical protein BC828DRAFT_392361 [Blastocladiella britannica]|nr:hypothetical protein BC828DRAFT_392361 [Blastocladiella britannica]
MQQQKEHAGDEESLVFPLADACRAAARRITVVQDTRRARPWRVTTVVPPTSDLAAALLAAEHSTQKSRNLHSAARSMPAHALPPTVIAYALPLNALKTASRLVPPALVPLLPTPCVLIVLDRPVAQTNVLLGEGDDINEEELPSMTATTSESVPVVSMPGALSLVSAGRVPGSLTQRRSPDDMDVDETDAFHPDLLGETPAAEGDEMGYGEPAPLDATLYPIPAPVASALVSMLLAEAMQSTAPPPNNGGIPMVIPTPDGGAVGLLLRSRDDPPSSSDSSSLPSFFAASLLLTPPVRVPIVSPPLAPAYPATTPVSDILAQLAFRAADVVAARVVAHYDLAPGVSVTSEWTGAGDRARTFLAANLGLGGFATGTSPSPLASAGTAVSAATGVAAATGIVLGGQYGLEGAPPRVALVLRPGPRMGTRATRKLRRDLARCLRWHSLGTAHDGDVDAAVRADADSPSTSTAADSGPDLRDEYAGTGRGHDDNDQSEALAIGPKATVAGAAKRARRGAPLVESVPEFFASLRNPLPFSHADADPRSESSDDNDGVDNRDRSRTLLATPGWIPGVDDLDSEPLTIPPRADLDFTERMWHFLTGAASLADMLAAFVALVEQLEAGAHFPQLAATNGTELAVALRELMHLSTMQRHSVEYADAADRVGSLFGNLLHNTLAAAVEIGMYKLGRDYAHAMHVLGVSAAGGRVAEWRAMEAHEQTVVLQAWRRATERVAHVKSAAPSTPTAILESIADDAVAEAIALLSGDAELPTHDDGDHRERPPEFDYVLSTYSTESAAFVQALPPPARWTVSLGATASSPANSRGGTESTFDAVWTIQVIRSDDHYGLELSAEEQRVAAAYRHAVAAANYSSRGGSGNGSGYGDPEGDPAADIEVARYYIQAGYSEALF